MPFPPDRPGFPHVHFLSPVSGPDFFYQGGFEARGTLIASKESVRELLDCEKDCAKAYADGLCGQ